MPLLPRHPADSMSTPAVSVLMSVYNGARYLKAAINSVLQQTFSDFEFLIIDDGSSDASPQILQAYAQQDSRIQVYLRSHRGIARSRNELLLQAKADLIACMDADDIALPQRLAQQLEFLRSHPQVVCLGGAFDWIDHQGNWLGHCWTPQSNAELQQKLLGGISLLHHAAAMVRRSAMLQVGGYEETMTASVDLDLWLRLGEIGQLANLSETVLQYRLHRHSLTQTQQAQQTGDALAACQRAWQRRGIAGTFVRQPADHMHQLEFWLKYGWQGFCSGRRDVAKRCGMRAVAMRPLNLAAWKLLGCAWIKPVAALETVANLKLDSLAHPDR